MEDRHDKTELFLRFSRQRMMALFVITAMLGGTGLTALLSPPGVVGSYENFGWWVLPLALAAVIAAIYGVRQRSWARDSGLVRSVADDEWRRANLGSATRIALIVVLAVQWPLAMMLSFFVLLPHPRGPMFMMFATITVALLTLIASFLYLDLE
jgi:drug/metabolite transporter (DMT)-like permease